VRDGNGEIRLFQVQGGYSDTLVKTDGGWRIKERKWNHAWIAGSFRFVDGMAAMLGKPE
jgi:hypothetical protein